MDSRDSIDSPDSMYSILMQLPLFKGVSRERMSHVIEKTRFHFLKFADGETFVKAGDPCDHVQFVLSGKARISVTDPRDRIRVSQIIEGPDVITPDFLFGRTPFYPFDITAEESCGILRVPKNDYLAILNCDNIFLFNFINYVSVDAQRGIPGILAVAGGDLAVRLAFWIVSLTQRGATDITLSCRHRDLYTIFGVQRSSLLATLEEMKSRGLIDYSAGIIYVRSREGLVRLVSDALK